MNNEIIMIIIIMTIFLLVLVYRRSIKIHHRLQMNEVFTNISHELLTPLTVISASIEKLHEQEPQHAKDYALMELNIERMTRLLQEILETSKSQAGELRLRVSQGDVIAYIRETALSIEPLMYKKGLTFDIQCNPHSMMGWIDTDKVDKIIYNLLSNAAKFTNTQGTVTLRVWTNEDFNQVTIEVSDNGIGIPANRIKHLFHRFYDGDYRWMKVNGTGLGLALTRDLVFLHNGTIHCTSEEGKGTTFTVSLPIRKEAYTPSQIDEQHDFDPTKPRKNIIDIRALEELPEQLVTPTVYTEKEDLYNILLVEDNEELLMLMKTLMSSKYNIQTATNGEEALKIIQNHDLDMIVSDVTMPEMDGNELTRLIKTNEDLHHLPIILISAKTSEEARKESMLIGADDFITKPFRLGDLELRINNIIENRKRIVGEKANTEGEIKGRPLTADEEFILKAKECVMKHLNDTEFDRDTFAAEMGASSSTLYNKLRSLTGMNINNYIRSIRMNEAKRIAKSQPDIRVSDLAYMVGFKDPKYFATCFKKDFGIQPSEIIAQAQEKTTVR
jgi:DNA-binding response OmpR family regulator/nitrogen-specific signal transduction histidine kinase